MKISSTAIFLFTLAVGAFLLLRNKGPSVEQVNQLANSSETIWIDVREEEEVRSGTLQSAIWIPLSLIQQGGDALNSALQGIDRNKKLALFCRSGNRSGIAGGILEKMGFQILNAGGFDGLASKGLPTHVPTTLIAGQKPVSEPSSK